MRWTPASWASRDERLGGLDVDLLGDGGILRAGGVADDRGEVHDLVDALERLGAGLGIADVAADELGAGGLDALGDVLLAVQQRVEHADLAAGLEQLLDGERADVAGATGDQNAGHRTRARSEGTGRKFMVVSWELRSLAPKRRTVASSAAYPESMRVSQVRGPTLPARRYPSHAASRLERCRSG